MMNRDHQPQQPETLPGERGIPGVAAPAGAAGRRRVGVALGVLAALGGLGALYWKSTRGGEEETQAVAKKGMEPTIPQKTFGEPPSPPPLPGVASAPSAPGTPKDELPPGFGLEELPPEPPRAAGGSRGPRPPVLDKGRSPLMATTQSKVAAATAEKSPEELAAAAIRALPAGALGATGATGLPGVSLSGSTAGASSASLGGRLSGTSTEKVSATFIGDRNFLLAKGSFIDCVLQTRLDSTVPGMTACTVTRNIFSDNGKVLLIERGSTVVGEYQSNIQQGQRRIFVLWSRIKTPHGVIVSLESPGTDALGGAGIPGVVNTHFWARFGGALLLSLVDDAAAAASLGQEGGQVFQFGNTAGAAQGAAAEAIRATIDIPPSLTKNQGETIGIYVARDLDFSGVYDVRAE